MDKFTITQKLEWLRKNPTKEWEFFTSTFTVPVNDKLSLKTDVVVRFSWADTDAIARKEWVILVGGKAMERSSDFDPADIESVASKIEWLITS